MHQTMQGTLHPVFNSRQLLLASTAKPVTPFGGLVSLIEFFNVLKLGEVLGRLMPFTYISPNAIPPEQTLLAFVLSIIAGARRLAHTDWLRADRALHAMLGIEHFPGTDTVRNLLKRFTQPVIEAFWFIQGSSSAKAATREVTSKTGKSRSLIAMDSVS